MVTETLNIAKKTDSSSESQNEELIISSGETTIIIGANGSGKTRLAVYIEELLGDKAHRIAAHRALTLKSDIQKITEDKAKKALKYGDNWCDDPRYRIGYRWHDAPNVALLDDFDKLLQYLFAEQTNIAIDVYQSNISGEPIDLKKSKLYQLKEAWEVLLPHRVLNITGDNIYVSTLIQGSQRYLASDMSDGERAIFYILGQVLSANENSILIFDEPELHIHKSIISNLWDKVEELRPDCAFIMITHDIEFASTRSAKKYIIRNYYPDPAWNITAMPDSKFDEQTITLILGSRKPILFVEGENNSLDIEIYRHCYPEWTIISKGSCKDVIQAVSSLEKLNEDMPLLNLKCAGIVDRDTREQSEIEHLNSLNIQVLPVSEIENIFSLTSIAAEILKLDGYQNSELDEKLAEYKKKLLSFIKDNLKDSNLDKFVIKRTQRKIDKYLKEIDLSENQSGNDMKNLLISKVNDLTNNQIEKWISEMKNEIESCFTHEDINKLLEIYENKGGLLNKTASILRGTKKDNFIDWLMRHLKNQNSELLQVIKQNLPNINM
ncbi:AAA family ATPase [Otariodibacter sp.]|uniref:AAA family ATPase n=1 Tax=Otariodibacter sp. TaxID=3030919 RepID=UPI0026095FA4|nr:AAA family ATPase [Otariodibacter sp.]